MLRLKHLVLYTLSAGVTRGARLLTDVGADGRREEVDGWTVVGAPVPWCGGRTRAALSRGACVIMGGFGRRGV